MKKRLYITCLTIIIILLSSCSNNNENGPTPTALPKVSPLPTIDPINV